MIRFPACRALHLLAVLALLGPILPPPASADEGPAQNAPNPVQKPTQTPTLEPFLSITWRLGPAMPQGLQDSDGGIVDNTLISIGGFCSGQKDVPGKLDKHPRGFLRKVWGLDLKTNDRWRDLPEFPGNARQGLDAVVVGDELYCWGGFSYEEPYGYRDGYRLSRRDDAWNWAPLPTLPWPVAAQGSCRVGSKIYCLGGADYDLTMFRTGADRTGAVQRLGARLLSFDTSQLDAGWKELAPCPGTPRFVHAVSAIGDDIYVFGGATDNDNAARQTCTVVDNWRYRPADDRWNRLPDLPVASGNFPSGPVVYANRYVLLIGGYQYGMVLGPDGAVRPPFGEPTRHYADNSMCSDIFVFDVEKQTFGTATPLPLNNNLPMAVVEGDQLHLIGGEIGSAVIEGENFGHHPDLYLVGTIRLAAAK